MSDVSGRSGRAPLVCASCAQSLFGMVRYCPFCGARQRDHVTSPETTARVEQNTGAKPLTRFGERAEAARPAPAPSAAQVMAPSTFPPAVANAMQGAEVQPKVTPPQMPGRASVPAQSPTVVVPLRSVSSTAVAPSPSSSNPSASSGKFKWIALLVLAGAGYVAWEFVLKPKPPDLCQQALESAASSMQASQFVQARIMALSAVARCTGDSQERAKTVLKAAESAQAAEENCGKAMRLADSQISDGRLRLALRTLDTQPGACLSREDSISRRQRIDSSGASAAKKVSQALTQATDGQFDEARASVSDAERLDRDNPDLAKTRREIEAKVRDAARASALPVAAPSVASPTPSPVVPSQSPIAAPPSAAPQVQQVDNAENNKRLECAVLVRTGSRALTNKSYDEAMQSAQEARTVFANCPGAQELLQSARQAKDRARQSITIQ